MDARTGVAGVCGFVKAGEADLEEELSCPATTRSGADLALLPEFSFGLTRVRTRACSCSP